MSRLKAAVAGSVTAVLAVTGVLLTAPTASADTTPEGCGLIGITVGSEGGPREGWIAGCPTYDKSTRFRLAVHCRSLKTGQYYTVYSPWTWAKDSSGKPQTVQATCLPGDTASTAEIDLG